MADLKTNLVITGEARGFERMARKMFGMSKEAYRANLSQAKSWVTVEKSVESFRKQMQSTAREQAKLTQELERLTDKESAAYKQKVTRLREVENEYERLERAQRNQITAHSKELNSYRMIEKVQRRLLANRDKARGGFLQGMVQGGAPGVATFLQRGPGMWRQAAGMGVGNFGRRMGSAGMAGIGSLWNGSSGLQQALSLIPGGEALGGLVGTATANAGQALQYYQTQQQVAPFLANMGQFGALGRSMAAGPQVMRDQRSRTLAARVNKYMGKAGAGDLTYNKTTGQYNLPTEVPEPKIAKDIDLPSEFTTVVRGYGKDTYPAKVRRKHWDRMKEKYDRSGREWTDYMMATEALKELRENAPSAGKARRGAQRGYGSVEAMGFDLLGVDKTTALQRGAEFAQASGTRNRAGLRDAMALQTVFGVGMGTSGMLSRGARMGALGGGGDPSSASRKIMADGIRLGLEGSDLVEYMQQAAQGIQQFRTTGIPFNRQAISDMTQAMQGRGINAWRGTQLAAGAINYAQTLGKRGLQSGTDALLAAGFGYEGGGAAEFEKAMLKAESGEGMQGAQDFMLTRLFSAFGEGRGAEARSVAQKRLSSMGMDMSLKEINLAYGRLMGGTGGLSQEEYDKALKASQGRKRGRLADTVESGTGLAGMARGMIAPGVKSQAALTNTQIAAGQNVLQTVQKLDLAATNMSNTVTKQLQPAMLKFAEIIDETSKKITKWMNTESAWDFIKNLVT
jgi:hypothetical protein